MKNLLILLTLILSLSLSSCKKEDPIDISDTRIEYVLNFSATHYTVDSVNSSHSPANYTWRVFTPDSTMIYSEVNPIYNSNTTGLTIAHSGDWFYISVISNKFDYASVSCISEDGSINLFKESDSSLQTYEYTSSSLKSDNVIQFKYILK